MIIEQMQQRPQQIPWGAVDLGLPIRYLISIGLLPHHPDFGDKKPSERVTALHKVSALGQRKFLRWDSALSYQLAILPGS